MYSKSYELSFIGDRMRTTGRQIAPQIVLRNCSKEVEARSVFMILVKGEFMQSSTYLTKRFSAGHKELMSELRGLC